MTESDSLVALRHKVTSLLPRVDLPELILEIAAITGFTEAFTHLSERTARALDLGISLSAVLMSEAHNTGLEPLIRGDVAALKRDRLPGWTKTTSATTHWKRRMRRWWRHKVALPW